MCFAFIQRFLPPRHALLLITSNNIVRMCVFCKFRIWLYYIVGNWSVKEKGMRKLQSKDHTNIIYKMFGVFMAPLFLSWIWDHPVTWLILLFSLLHYNWLVWFHVTMWFFMFINKFIIIAFTFQIWFLAS